MTYSSTERAAMIVHDAGGQVVGRTRLQKIGYLLHATGLESGLSFVYKHYGPYSEELATGARTASSLGLLDETERQASWGGAYSTYDFVGALDNSTSDPARRQLATLAASADAIELELAATAAFLAKEGYTDAWAETERRKPEKAIGDRIDKAKELYRSLRAVKVPIPLPQL